MSRRVPPPWSDAIGHALAYVYSKMSGAPAAKLLTCDEAQRIAGNIDKLPRLSEARHDRQAPLTRRAREGRRAASDPRGI